MPKSRPGENTQKRIEIADAALRIIGSRGITGLTTAALAAELGVSPGAPFRHFKSRAEILEAVARRIAGLIGTTFPDPGLPPLERLEGLFRARAEMLGKASGIARLIFSDQFTKALPPEAAVHIHGVVKQTRAFVLQALRDAAEGGLIRGDIPPEDLLVPVMGTLQHLGFLAALPPGGRNFKRPDPAHIVATLFALLK
jgi:AcrR family transcriptional regulator